MGIRGVAQHCLSDNLSNRQKFASFDGVDSKCDKIACWIPQGSMLGAFLFLPYVNDIADISKLLLPVVFADDRNKFLSGKNVNETMSLFNIELCHTIY